MSAISGHECSFKVLSGSSATVVGYLDNWSISINQSAVEVSSLGKKAKEFISGPSDWSGSVSGAFDPEDAQQKSLMAALNSGALIEGTFAIGASHGYKGSLIPTSVSLGASHGDKVTFSVNFQGTGDLTALTV